LVRRARRAAHGRDGAGPTSQPGTTRRRMPLLEHDLNLPGQQLPLPHWTPRCTPKLTSRRSGPATDPKLQAAESSAARHRNRSGTASAVLPRGAYVVATERHPQAGRVTTLLTACVCPSALRLSPDRRGDRCPPRVASQQCPLFRDGVLCSQSSRSGPEGAPRPDADGRCAGVLSPLATQQQPAALQSASAFE